MQRRGPADPAAVDAPGSSYDDPMAQVLSLDSGSSGPARWLGYGLCAIALMVGGALGVRYVEQVLRGAHVRASQAVPQEVDIQVEAPPPPPPAKIEDKPEPAPPPKAMPRETPPSPPPLAQAGKVLTREPDPNEPVDLTGDTIVTGEGDAYRGGVTAANGTSKTAVREMAAPGVASAAPARAPPPGPDRSRPARLAGDGQWNADFPEEANAAQIDDAYVVIEAVVRADGRPASVRVLVDPGHGFGRQARNFALSQRFDPALDRDGHPIESTNRVRVHFSR